MGFFSRWFDSSSSSSPSDNKCYADGGGVKVVGDDAAAATVTDPEKTAAVIFVEAITAGLSDTISSAIAKGIDDSVKRLRRANSAQTPTDAGEESTSLAEQGKKEMQSGEEGNLEEHS